MSDLLASVISASVSASIQNHLETILAKFTQAVAVECNIDAGKLEKIWEDVAPEYASSISSLLDKENKRKKKLEEKNDDVACKYVFGPKAGRAGEECSGVCKDPAPQEDGKTYCNKHKKQILSKHVCEFVFGEKAKKAGEYCSARIAKDEVVFVSDENEYDNKWLCKRHKVQTEKAIERSQNQCTHVYGPKSKRANERCSSIAKNGTKCAKHDKKPREPEPEVEDVAEGEVEGEVEDVAEGEVEGEVEEEEVDGEEEVAGEEVEKDEVEGEVASEEEGEENDDNEILSDKSKTKTVKKTQKKAEKEAEKAEKKADKKAKKEAEKAEKKAEKDRKKAEDKDKKAEDKKDKKDKKKKSEKATK
jgi:hypothetical protein